MIAVRLFLVDDLPEVELEFFTLEDVTVNTAALARAGRDASVETASAELGLEAVGELGTSGTSSSLGGLADSLRLLTLGRGRDTVVGLEELTEGSGVDLDNGTLGQGVGTDQLVVRGVVDNRDDTGLAGNTLGAPGEVTGVQTESTELLVTTANTDRVDTLGSNLGVSGLTAHLELPLLAELSAHGASVRTLVTRIATDTHMCCWLVGKEFVTQKWYSVLFSMGRETLPFLPI